MQRWILAFILYPVDRQAPGPREAPPPPPRPSPARPMTPADRPGLRKKKKARQLRHYRSSFVLNDQPPARLGAPSPMEVFVQRALKKIKKETSRKHKALRESCNTVLRE